MRSAQNLPESTTSAAECLYIHEQTSTYHSASPNYYYPPRISGHKDQKTGLTGKSP